MPTAPDEPSNQMALIKGSGRDAIQPPDFLGPAAAEVFSSLAERLEAVESGSSWMYSSLTVLAAQYLADVQQCDAEIKETGRTYMVTNAAGVEFVLIHPLVRIRQEYMTIAMSCLESLGLTRRTPDSK